MKRSRTYWRLKWQRRAARHKARGLTTRGTAPVLQRWTELDHLHGAQRNQERDRLRYVRGVIQQGNGALHFLIGRFASGKPSLLAQLKKTA